MSSFNGLELLRLPVRQYGLVSSKLSLVSGL